MRPLHDYAPREQRVWEGSNGRCERILMELNSYQPDVIHLQEVRARVLVFCTSVLYCGVFVPAFCGAAASTCTQYCRMLLWHGP